MPVALGKSILFRWEDSERLKHHCGFCDRPLSHPNARTSCFGPHAEPCFRFHQAMFMRNRGHTCDICSHVDEKHHERHHAMCEQIRAIYACNGEDWPIIPNDEDDRGRSRSRSSHVTESGSHRSSTSGDVPLTKREKKDHKKQIRAASRTKVITQEEIKYVDSVLHPAASQQYAENPNNPEEVQEIEDHLKYNAQCYNEGIKRSDIRKFAHMPDADIDFAAEIDRVFDIFRIAELIKRNERNRGLRNKELASFNAIVADFKKQITDDLVIAKRDEMEIRMRRAAFLRYTNRASYDIMATRYTDKDWKTGQKIRSTADGSTSSGSLTAVEEEYEDDDAKDLEVQSLSVADPDRRHLQQAHVKIGSNGVLEEFPAMSATKTLVEDVPKPTLSLRITNTDIPPQSKIQFLNPWKQLKKPMTSSQTLPPDPIKYPALNPNGIGWQTAGAPHISSPLTPRDIPKYPWPAVKPSRVGVVAQLTPAEDEKRREAIALRDAHRAEIYKDLSQRRQGEENMDPKKERHEIGAKFDNHQLEHAKCTPSRIYSRPSPETKTNKIGQHEYVSHAPVESRKKKDKKKQREVERKARRAAEKENAPPTSTSFVLVDTPNLELPTTEEEHVAAELTDPVLGHVRADTPIWEPPISIENISCEGRTDVKDSSPTLKQSMTETELSRTGSRAKKAIGSDSISSESTLVPSSTSGSISNIAPCEPVIPTTKIGRHDDWVKYVSFTKVDRFSEPMFTPSHPAFDGHSSCLFSEECLFESSGTPDCPYHKTICNCVDPLNPNNDKCIVYPQGGGRCGIGPYNYIHAEKLMRFFDAQPETKGKVMIIDAELYLWLCTEGKRWRMEEIDCNELQNTPMPQNLNFDVQDYMSGYTKGKSFKKVDEFREMARRNARWCSRSALTKDMLEALRKTFEPATWENTICYCRHHEPENLKEEDMVVCGYHSCPAKMFHQRCVKEFGLDKLSTWYCGFCEKYMSIEGQKAVIQSKAMYLGKPVPEFDDEDDEDRMQSITDAVEAFVTGHTCGGY